MRTSKVGLLVSRPNEAYDRIRNKMNSWAQLHGGPSKLVDVAKAATLATAVSDLFPQVLQPEIDCSEIKSYIDKQGRQLKRETQPFGIFHNGTTTLGELCFRACRFLRPKTVVETGVAYGVTSAYILQALAENNCGDLHSIDLPPLVSDADRYVGHFVPQELRTRWKLYRGSAKRLLPTVLRETGAIDLFVHDSLHTYSHMKWEFEVAVRSLRPGGVLIFDDIEGNRAFEEATRHPSIASWFAIQQQDKDAICGALRTRS